MKTSVTMVRQMGGFDVQQRTKDGMFNATELLKQWNNINSNPKRDLSKFWTSVKVNEFIEALMEEENLDTPKQVYVKSRASRGKNAGTWVHPYLFIKLAMWINPKFEVKVVKFVYDELIRHRHNAGDNYRLLSESGMKIEGYDFSAVATAMNWIVFGRKAKELRQVATQDQLMELSELQTKLSFSIDMGYISTFPILMDELRKIYKIKQNKTPF